MPIRKTYSFSKKILIDKTYNTSGLLVRIKYTKKNTI